MRSALLQTKSSLPSTSKEQTKSLRYTPVGDCFRYVQRDGARLHGRQRRHDVGHGDGARVSLLDGQHGPLQRRRHARLRARLPYWRLQSGTDRPPPGVASGAKRCHGNVYDSSRFGAHRRKIVRVTVTPFFKYQTQATYQGTLLWTRQKQVLWL